MKKILVSWSIAYDYIMESDNNFAWVINADSNWIVSSSMLINSLKKETGWTWLNIAFNLAMLSEDAILLWAIWDDFEFDNFIKEKINLTYIHKSRTLLSSSAYIINDNSWWQITSFYPWAMEEAWNISVSDIKEEISYLMVSPNKKQAMLKHIDEWNKHWIKTFFDPGQMLVAFTKEELLYWAEHSNYLIVNEVEFNEFMRKTSKDEVELLDFFEKIIVTLWVNWSKIIDRSWVIHIKAVEVDELVDPTWAWDAFRAWLLKWLKHWYDFETSAKIWSIVASYCVQFDWWQNHFVNIPLVIEDMNRVYWIDLNF